MSQYSHIFFDLDRTLWDFEKSSHLVFLELFDKYNFPSLGIPTLDAFYEVYRVHNNYLWEQYRQGNLDKDTLIVERFAMTFKDFGKDDKAFGATVGHDYVKLSGEKNILFPGTYDILEYLSNKYPLYIITNGFEKVQVEKMRLSGLDKYFVKMFTSESVGVNKPDKRIFEHALREVGAEPHTSLMIGDDLQIDIDGAANVGMKTVWFNPTNIQIAEPVANYEVNELMELKGIL